ncbi:MAG: HDIG domain-containing metalloprotein [Thermodesulfobacteriota bacterium]
MIPSPEECLQLMTSYAMLDNIRAHSIMVARVADYLSEELQRRGAGISHRAVIAGALLHDIAKTECIRTGCDHASEGREICLRHGFVEIADIVGDHVVIRNGGAAPLGEREIVYYADKRVTHEAIVGLAQRRDYILARYGNDDPRRIAAIEKNFLRCQRMEREIFALLDIEPEQLAATVLHRNTTFLT